MRAFVALTLPSGARRHLLACQDRLTACRADVSWVAESALHLTLKFLGDIAEEQRQALASSLQAVGGRTAPFSLRLGGVGAFPGAASPRIVWAGLAEGGPAAAALAADVEAAAETCGVPREARGFHAHVTLGRVRSTRRLPTLAAVLREGSWPESSPWTAEALVFFQSVLGPEGPAYTALATAAFGGASQTR